MSDWGRRCPVCGATVRHTHHCHARALADPPLEGDEAAAWARRIKEQLRAVKAPTGAEHVGPVQPPMTFGSGGL